MPAPRKTKSDSVVKADTSWFAHDRFGLFIHWGLYALPARHEWVKRIERMTTGQYQQYFDHFDPDLFDPAAWARAARLAGMKYFVITTKHHDGFCLWDSKHTDYKATRTPYGKDLLKPIVKAFRDEGLKVGFYHSLIDWHHPEYPVDKTHPQYEDPAFHEKAKTQDVRKYANYLHAQVRELLTGFGKIDLLWFDFSFPGKDGKGRDDWQSEKLLRMVRELQPGIIVNNRLDLPGPADLVTPEQYVPAGQVLDEKGKPQLWEGCQTLSGSWGYHRDESTWKTGPMLVRMLIDHVSKGGNLLLNVGPTGRGQLDGRALGALEAMGDWMQLHERAIYGCTCAPEGLNPPPDCRYTFNPKTRRLYLHLFAWPFRHVHLPGLRVRVTYAQLLNDASEIRFEQTGSDPHSHLKGAVPSDALTLQLPVVAPGVEVPVVELFLAG